MTEIDPETGHEDHTASGFPDIEYDGPESPGVVVRGDSYEDTMTKLAAIRQAQIDEAASTLDQRLTVIVENLIRSAAQGNAWDAAYYVTLIKDHAFTTSLTDEQRTWLTLLPEGDEDEPDPDDLRAALDGDDGGFAGPAADDEQEDTGAEA